MIFFRSVALSAFMVISGSQIAQTQGEPVISSAIIKSFIEDTVPMKLLVRSALYDPHRNYLSYHLVTKNTLYPQKAIPTLLVKKTLPVAEAHARVIRKYFINYLTGSF